MTLHQLTTSLVSSIELSSLTINEGHNNLFEVVASDGITLINALLVQGSLSRVIITGFRDPEEIGSKVLNSIYSVTQEVPYETVWLREAAPSEEGYFTRFDVGM